MPTTEINAAAEIARLKEILSEKDAEIQRLKKQLEKDGNMVYKKPYYFLVKENGEEDGPYCQLCHDNDKKLIRLQSSEQKGEWICNKCQTIYKDSSYKKKEPVPYCPRAPL